MKNESDDESEKCIVCGGKEPCSHNFDKMDKELNDIFRKMGTMQRIDGFPRRNIINHLTPIEHSIHNVIQSIEHCGESDTFLTDAVVLLLKAKDKFSDFVDIKMSRGESFDNNNEWTNNKPTEPGFYWVKYQGKSYAYVHVIEVRFKEDKLCAFFTDCWNYRNFLTDEEYWKNVKFSSRIYPPKIEM